jgi:hypothetical protein
VLSSDVPVLAAEVRERELGLVADPTVPTAVAGALRAMLEPQAQRAFREAVAALAPESDWAREREVLASVYSRAA